MPSIHRDIEFTVAVGEDSEAKSRARALIRSCGANVLAWRVASRGRELSWICEDARKAIHTLDAAGLQFRIDTVVVVRMSNKFGALAMLDAYLRNARIGIRYSYASSSESRYVHMVFKTTDDSRAVKVLSGSLLPAWIGHRKVLRRLFLKGESFLHGMELPDECHLQPGRARLRVP